MMASQRPVLFGSNRSFRTITGSRIEVPGTVTRTLQSNITEERKANSKTCHSANRRATSVFIFESISHPIKENTVRRKSGFPIAAFAARAVFRLPLKMASSVFRRSEEA